MSTFISDVSKLGLGISLCILTVLATITATVILASMAVVSLPILIVIAPTLITCLCLYATYQAMYPTVPSVVHGPSHEDEAYLSWLPCEDEDTLVLQECATWEEYHAQFTQHDTTPVCSMTYALIATTGTMDDTYLAPAYLALPSPVTITSEDIDNAIAEDSISPMDTQEQDETSLLHCLSDAALLARAKSLGVKGVNSRWKRATLISRIMEATFLTVAA